MDNQPDAIKLGDNFIIEIMCNDWCDGGQRQLQISEWPYSLTHHLITNETGSPICNLACKLFLLKISYRYWTPTKETKADSLGYIYVFELKH